MKKKIMTLVSFYLLDAIGLKWGGEGGVKEALEPILDERIVVVSL